MKVIPDTIRKLRTIRTNGNEAKSVDKEKKGKERKNERKLS